MKKILYSLLFSFLCFGAMAQTYGPVPGQTLQRASTTKGYVYRINMGAFGFLYLYTAPQVDSIITASAPKITANFPLRISPSRFLGPYANGDTIKLVNATLADVVTDLTTQVVHPNYVAPTNVVTTTQPPVTYEYGHVFSGSDIGLGVVFTQNNGGSSTGTTYLKNGSSTGTPANFTLTSTTTFQAVTSYLQGPVLNNNLGNPDPVGRITAGSVTSATATFTPGFQMYRGFLSDTTAIRTVDGADDAAIIANGIGFVSTRIFTGWNTGTPAGGGQFTYIAYPAADGALSGIKFNGTPSLSAVNQITRNLRNAQGSLVSYIIVYTRNIQTIGSIVDTQ